MKTVQDQYPVFEANQVLSNLHLNEVVDYLGEQARLTRVNLIGIGIVCGLEARLNAAGTAVGLSRGCGTTSEGYLAVEQDDVDLVCYRKYVLPQPPAYAPFRDKSVADHPQYPMWELFPAGEPDTTPLDTPAGFLDDKAVLLFVELDQQALRNCSPNNCNDRGAEVTVILRRLLIGISDLAAILAESAALESGLTLADLDTALSARQNLPDLRLPRYDVPNTGLATSEQVLTAFHDRIRAGKLVQQLGKAFGAAYQAFRPLVQDSFPSDPFAGVAARFGGLDNAPASAAQVRFLQYFCDFFSDLIRAYDELRALGAELMCACCPPAELFPRHLMLGVLRPATVPDAANYRHGFLPSCAGETQTQEFRQLFRRLVCMVDSFTHEPPLPEQEASSSRADAQIRITPGAPATQPLADAAIPYYYRQDGTPPLYRQWSPEKSRRNRANQNPGYRSDEYSPAAPPFVLEPLRYEPEPGGFLRIEGHLGKNVQRALTTLLSLRTRHRLPIDVIALRTGVFDESAELDLSRESARFEDLETLYDVLREELLTALREGVRYLYDIPLGLDLPGGTPQLPLLRRGAASFRYAPGSVGAWYEKYLTLFQTRPYIDVDQNKIDVGAVMTVYCFLFAGTRDLPEANYAHVVSVYYLAKLSEVLPDRLDQLAFADFENKYQDLIGLTRYLRSDAARQTPPDLQKFAPTEELIDAFDQILYSCNLEPVRALHDEYLRRIRAAWQNQFLSFFLQRNPGIRHSAGVPLGGTFILVYHAVPEPAVTTFRPDRRAALLTTSVAAGLDVEALTGAIGRIRNNRPLALDPDIRFLVGALTGKLPDPDIDIPPPAGDEAARIIRETVRGLADGTVIADFYLPYLCCGDKAPVQYLLPTPRLGLSIALGCTDANGNASATLTASAGVAPLTYRIDDQPYQPLAGPVLLNIGTHTLAVRDAVGTESAQQTVNVPAALAIGQESYGDDVANLTYAVAFSISGGTPPYMASTGTVAAGLYTSPPVPSAQSLTVQITDSAGCQTAKVFTHVVVPPCNLPCGGFALRCGYRFWLPEADPERPYQRYVAEVAAFRFEFPPGSIVDIRQDVAGILKASVDDLNANFDTVASRWIEQINKRIATAAGSDDWLRLEYERADRGMAVLWIERFECLKFEFDVRPLFVRRDQTQQLAVIHTPVGTAIRHDGDLVNNIAPFNCSRIAKCDPARPVEQRCGELDLKLRIVKQQTENMLKLEAAASGSDQPVAFLWEVQDAVPAIAEGKGANFTIATREPPVKNIRLSAFTDKGCMTVVTTTHKVA